MKQTENELSCKMPDVLTKNVAKNQLNNQFCGLLILLTSESKQSLTEITFPRADKDLLMLAPSFNLSPVAPVLSARSEPTTRKFNYRQHESSITDSI